MFSSEGLKNRDCLRNNIEFFDILNILVLRFKGWNYEFN